MIEATKIITAEGDSLVVERGPERCMHSEEVEEFAIVVPVGTTCDICEEEISADEVDE